MSDDVRQHHSDRILIQKEYDSDLYWVATRHGIVAGLTPAEVVRVIEQVLSAKVEEGYA